MDTKSKIKFKETLIFIGAIYCLVICIGFISCTISEIRGHCATSYFNSNEFMNHVEEMYSDIIMKAPDGSIRDDEFDELRYRYQDDLNNEENRMEDEYSNRINYAEESRNFTLANSLKAERDRKLNELRKNNTKSDKEIKEEIIKNKQVDYKNRKEFLKNRQDLKYYVKNDRTGQIDTNIEDPSQLNKVMNNSMYSIKFPQKKVKSRYEGMNDYWESKECTVFFIVPNDIKKDTTIYNEYRNFNRSNSNFNKRIAISIWALVMVILISVYLKKNWTIYRKKFIKVYDKYAKIPLDIRYIIAFFMIFMVCIILSGSVGLIKKLSFDLGDFIAINVLCVCFMYFACCIYDIRKIKRNNEYFKEQKSKMFISKIRNYLNESAVYKSVLFKVVIFSVITTGVSASILAMPTLGDAMIPIGLIYLAMYFFIVVPRVLKKIGKFNKIVDGTKKMAEGDLNFTIDIKTKGALGELANNINNIKDGYNKAVAEELKSQQFKSELITNVSHDLKTPLTSIINYIKLLQQEGLSKEEIDGYIGVLDRKSQRLKTLIEDLFEASKVSTGAVELNIEKLDVVSLLKQALGEFEEKIENSSLDFKVNIPTNPIYCNLDGKKTWRLFENLIGNILKYSQENTRVYIDLEEKNNNVIITMKNISSYEMNFDPEELFERFKRGDESRSTEGSGLGLAIANSIAELEGGKLDINIDGDLFKSIVEFKVEA